MHRGSSIFLRNGIHMVLSPEFQNHRNHLCEILGLFTHCIAFFFPHIPNRHLSIGDKRLFSSIRHLQGNTLFEFEFERRAFMTSAVSVNGLFIVVPSVDKSGDVLNVYHAKTGTYINCFTPKYNEFSDAHNLIPMPHDVSVQVLSYRSLI